MAGSGGEPHDASTSKVSWRAWARERARHLDRDAWSRAACAALRAWPPFERARCIGAYRSLGRHEVDLDPLLIGDRRAAFPRTRAASAATDGDWTTSWARPASRTRTYGSSGGTTGGFVRHPLGMLQPDDDAHGVDERTVDLVLVPGMAFDRFGTRLGRGGGQYDRLLSTCRPGTLRVGVTHPRLLSDDALPREAHDVPMTHLLVWGAIVPIGDVA